MEDNIQNSTIYLISTKDISNPYKVLGTAILSHLLAIFYGGILSQINRSVLNIETIHSYGLLYSNSKKNKGYRNAWIGKAFEYAVAELFNNKQEPYYSLIRLGIEQAISINNRQTRIDLDNLSCVLVAKESDNTKNLIQEFGRYRTLKDARYSLQGVANKYQYFESKVDAIFCENNSSEKKFAITCSFKSNRVDFQKDSTIKDFQSLPLDIGITSESPQRKGVRFVENLNAFIIYLPIDITPEISAWNNATRIVEQALLEGQRNSFLKFFQGLFKSGTPENYWIDFLSSRLNNKIEYVVEEMQTQLNGEERKIIVPTMFGSQKDASLDLKHLLI
jgi:hypothetical protein